MNELFSFSSVHVGFLHSAKHVQNAERYILSGDLLFTRHARFQREMSLKDEKFLIFI